MLSKCLNPSCSRPFRYLHEGRIFQLQIARQVPDSEAIERRIECFWLCSQCSTTLKVVMKNGAAGVEPRYLELPWAEAVTVSSEDEHISGRWQYPARDR